MLDKFDEKVKNPLEISVSYEDAKGNKFDEDFKIDLSEFMGMGDIEPHMVKIASSPEKIQKNIEHLATGFKKVKVDV